MKNSNKFRLPIKSDGNTSTYVCEMTDKDYVYLDYFLNEVFVRSKNLSRFIENKVYDMLEKKEEFIYPNKRRRLDGKTIVNVNEDGFKIKKIVKKNDKNVSEELSLRFYDNQQFECLYNNEDNNMVGVIPKKITYANNLKPNYIITNYVSYWDTESKDYYDDKDVCYLTKYSNNKVDEGTVFHLGKEASLAIEKTSNKIKVNKTSKWLRTNNILNDETFLRYQDNKMEKITIIPHKMVINETNRNYLEKWCLDYLNNNIEEYELYLLLNKENKRQENIIEEYKQIKANVDFVLDEPRYMNKKTKEINNHFQKVKKYISSK